MDWLYLFTYIELRSGPKVHWQHEFHVDQVWWEGLSPQNQWIPLFLIELGILGILGMSKCTYQIISTYHNCREKFAAEPWGTQRTGRVQVAGNPSQPDHVASHLRRKPKLQADSASCPKDILRICRLRNIQGSCNRLVYFAQKSVLKTLVHLTSKSKVAFRPSETWRTSIIASIWPISILVTMSSIRNVWLVN